MNDATMWSFDPGSSGVLAPGRWLCLRAVLWTVLLSAGAFAFFESTQYLGSWLHLPQNSSYAIVLGIPILAFVVYALVVRVAERRSPVEVLPSARTVSDILIGAAIGVVMLSITTAMLWALGLYQIKPNHLNHAFDSFVFDSYLSGMMEELLFRAILLRILARAFGPRWGLALSAVAFGLASESWLVAPRPGDHDRRRPHSGPALYGDRPALDGDWDAHGMGFLRGIVPRSEHS